MRCTNVARFALLLACQHGSAHGQTAEVSFDPIVPAAGTQVEVREKLVGTYDIEAFENSSRLSPEFVPLPCDSRPHARVKINGRAALAVLDTGSSGLVVSQAFSERLGLRTVESPVETAAAMQTYSRSLDPVTAELPGFASDFDGAVVMPIGVASGCPDASPDVIIGLPLFQEMDLAFAPSSGFALMPADASSQMNRQGTLPIGEGYGGMPLVSASVQGKPLVLEFDTGLGSGLMLSHDALETLGEESLDLTIGGTQIAAGPEDLSSAPLAELWVGRGLDGLLGPSLLQHCSYRLSVSSRKMWLSC